MRLQALVLPALLLALACKSDPGDASGGSSSAEGCTVDVVGDLDPNYPPCDCDYKCEDAEAMCRFTDMSSVCEPPCTNDDECPSLAGLGAVCRGGHCFVPCNADKPCPSGYTCLENIQCQALR